MNHLYLYLDDPVSAPGILPQAEAHIALRALDGESATRLSDGERIYALYELTEQADELAMRWARSTCSALASTSWTGLLTYQGIDLQPLLVNRLFRGFFLDRARIYLGVQRILEAESPQRVTIFSSSDTDTLFAHAACLEADVELASHRLPAPRAQRVPASSALRTFARDIAGPALKRGFSRPRSRQQDRGIPHVVLIEREEMTTQMVAGAFEVLRAESPVAITIVRFEARHTGPAWPEAHHRDGADYQNLTTLLRLVAHEVRVMTLRNAGVHWPEPVLARAAPYILRFLRQVAVPSIVHTLQVIRRVVHIERPSLLVVVDETGLVGKAVALQGRHLGIPTLNVQHGVRTDSPWIEDQLFDRFAVFGPTTSEVFLQRGNDPSIFVPTGAPRYDRLFRRRGLKSRQQVAAELGLDASRPIVTFASQHAWGRMTPTVKRETLLALLRACRQAGVQLVVKLRHGQPDYVPVEAMRDPGWEHVKVAIEYDLYNLLNASDVVATAYSTVGMEAVALGKPLLIVNLTGQPDPIPYVEEGVALGVYQPDRVSAAMSHLLTTGQPHRDWAQRRQDFIRRHLTSDDGRSAERLAHLMREMIESKQETRNLSWIRPVSVSSE
jgi:hypothetical protein